MFPKLISYGSESREKLLKGIDALADAVKVTLGPNGRNAIIKNKNQRVRTTKDGVSVAREIELYDEYESLGAELLREVAIKTCDVSGDGTTTATVLAQDIIKSGMAYINNGSNPAKLKKGIDDAVQASIEYLRAKSIKITKPEEVISIATIAANGDKEVGKVIAETFDKVGSEGVIILEESISGKTESTLVEGFQINSGYISPYFITNNTKMICELENPYIILHDRTISTLQPMLRLLDSIVRANDSLLIIAQDVDSEALATLVINKARHNYKIVAIKSPSFGEFRKDIIDDLLIMTGTKLISEETGIKLESVTKEMLGRAKKIIISQDKTTIVGGCGDKDKIQERCDFLKEKIEECKDSYYKSQFEERIGRLTNGIAVIRVGGMTELEIRERKDRVEDAVHATRAAMQEGILPGGGVSLIRARKEIEENQYKTTFCDFSESNGFALALEALHTPIEQILTNGGMDPEEFSHVIDIINQSDNFNYGYDAVNEEYVDMIEAGIIDPTKVVITALKDAASIATLILSTEVVIVEENEITLSGIQAPGNPYNIRT
jgi:chaperonin GroEL